MASHSRGRVGRIDKTPVDPIGAWLLRAGLENTDIPSLIDGYAARLNEAEFALSRLVIGYFTLHPVYGAIDYTWTRESGATRASDVPREALTTARFQDSPFFALTAAGRTFDRLRPGDARGGNSRILDDLAASGTTDYCVFREPFESRARLQAWNEPERGIEFNEGVMGSLATTRVGGFAEPEVERLKALFPMLGLAIRAHANHRLARTMLDTYLGTRSGARVLAGEVGRGDGQTIRAVICIVDLRGSTRLAEHLALDDYLAMINGYFDCTAGAVMARGGEVLKFLGDGVLAIFPLESGERPSAVAARAIDAAGEMLDRIARLNRTRLPDGEEALRIGIALHVGEILYGNVGTERRLDFTVTGGAVNEAAKLEGLCKILAVPIVASARFRALCAPGSLLPAAAPGDDPAHPTVYTLATSGGGR